jgi:hypothetical protein
VRVADALGNRPDMDIAEQELLRVDSFRRAVREEVSDDGHKARYDGSNDCGPDQIIPCRRENLYLRLTLIGGIRCG